MPRKRWFWDAPVRSDDEIAAIVVAAVKSGAIKPELAHMYASALQDEADGKSIVMRDPGIRPRPPKKPSWSW
jgi:hypothetical protein